MGAYNAFLKKWVYDGSMCSAGQYNGERMECGTFSIPSAGSVGVTFTTAFTAAPIVTTTAAVTIVANDRFVYVYYRGAGGFSVASKSNAGAFEPTNGCWIAIGS